MHDQSLQTIATPRLILKQPETVDAPAIFQAINDWEVIRWLSRVPYPYKKHHAVEFIRRNHECVDNGSAYQFLILFQDKVEGCVGLDYHEEEFFNLGYWVARRSWGAGLATEAVHAIIRFAFENLGEKKIYAACHDTNVSSTKVLEKNGFGQIGSEQQFSKALGKVVRVRQFALERNAPLRLQS